ncbi:hypothetical protein G6F57_001640 [Rhizopus arrhizus]|uniref:ER-bound oxygenase mpaB/mpaB'/Rubber oxygenase catalytic domain-containing protein n=1 Tax=Rhizopus oryzae TaxID=64495 RepID=A0A9P6XJ76_RHIOR|nr:hypothetical protein G6F23_002743 [Rhizopus arrhizus]KAG1429135.1 hypothetical protein G6F58_000215 [Rhizopus delemar]KAG0769184.1 hypothetical protein G6F24_001292 [Rhizopus arrhizus]KAG0790926.1 hypothetical protein G6F22_006280 [Rhizopus arrhizus]KAG0797263.1 hypothetical protein G6F21_000662 [Rhizopus arrhizus]
MDILSIATSSYRSIAISSTLLVVISYLIYVRQRRYKHLHNMIKKYPDPRVVLENHDIAMEIYSDIFRKEFPLFARSSLEFALFKPFATPSVSKLLVSTREFLDRCPRRAEDTELILSEIIDPYPRIQNELLHNPNISEKEIMKQYERREASIQRLNEIHGKYPISNEDYLYTLVLFVAEPLRWLNSWEWRKLDIREVNAIFKVWHEIGTKMNIKGIPDTLDEWYVIQQEYVSTSVKYHPANWTCADPTIKHLGKKLPGFMLPILYTMLPCLLEKPDCDAFGLNPPSLPIRIIFNTILYLRARFVRYLCLPRKRYDLRTPFHANKHGKYVPHYFVYDPPIYKDGYRVEELGPEKFLPKCPVVHH